MAMDGEFSSAFIFFVWKLKCITFEDIRSNKIIPEGKSIIFSPSETALAAPLFNTDRDCSNLLHFSFH